MTYKLKFHEKALKEWQKLGEPVKSQLKKKLLERLENPHIQADRLQGSQTALYKIKLRSAGYRLVYEVNDNEITVLVLSVGKRERLHKQQNQTNFIKALLELHYDVTDPEKARRVFENKISREFAKKGIACEISPVTLRNWLQAEF